MSDMTIEQFCDKHNACQSGRDWAVANCESMQYAWAKLKPEWLIWVATRKGVLTDQELRLFAVWCARQVQHLMSDPRSIAALDVAERHANGNATHAELAAAWAAADWAADQAADPANRAAAWAAARAAAWAAAPTAAPTAARAADRAADWAAQSDWLRMNCVPNFQEAKP